MHISLFSSCKPLGQLKHRLNEVGSKEGSDVNVEKKEGEVEHFSVLTTRGTCLEEERKWCGFMKVKEIFSLFFELGFFLFRGIRSLTKGSRHEGPRPRATQRLQGRRPSQPRWFR